MLNKKITVCITSIFKDFPCYLSFNLVDYFLNNAFKIEFYILLLI